MREKDTRVSEAREIKTQQQGEHSPFISLILSCGKGKQTIPPKTPLNNTTEHNDADTTLSRKHKVSDRKQRWKQKANTTSEAQAARRCQDTTSEARLPGHDTTREARCSSKQANKT